MAPLPTTGVGDHECRLAASRGAPAAVPWWLAARAPSLSPGDGSTGVSASLRGLSPRPLSAVLPQSDLAVGLDALVAEDELVDALLESELELELELELEAESVLLAEPPPPEEA